MKWFQHDSDASHDAKIKKLILRHGAEGYAVYFHCLELIAGDLTQQNINFELEHDAEIIADNLKIISDNNTSGIDKVNKILKTIIELGLFTIENNRVFCFKMANRLDNTVSRSSEINKIKQLRSNYANTTKKLGAEENTIHDMRSHENKRDKNKINKNKKDYTEFSLPPSLEACKEFKQTWETWLTYRKEIHKKITPTMAVAQLSKLEKVGLETAIEMIRQSIENGWQGLFPLREKKNKIDKDSYNYQKGKELLGI